MVSRCEIYSCWERYSSMEHRIDAIVVGCSDYRVELAVERWLREHRFYTRDRLLIPGVVKYLAVANRNPLGGFLANEVVSLVDGHRPAEIVVFTHDDCLAYGGSARFSSPEEERRHLTAELEDAAETIRKRLPAQDGPVICLLFIRDTASGSPVAYEVH